jgi:ankyrin repeat protein
MNDSVIAPSIESTSTIVISPHKYVLPEFFKRSKRKLNKLRDILPFLIDSKCALFEDILSLIFSLDYKSNLVKIFIFSFEISFFAGVKDIFKIMTYNYSDCIHFFLESVGLEKFKSHKPHIEKMISLYLHYYPDSVNIQKNVLVKKIIKTRRVNPVYILEQPIKYISEYPLHVALRYKNICHTIIDTLLRANRACEIEDKDEKYPLYTAMQNQYPTWIIEKIAHLAPKVLTIKIKKSASYYPIHVAIEKCYPSNLILYFLKEYKSDLGPFLGSPSLSNSTEKFYFNRSIIHLALEKSVNKEIIFKLINKYPDIGDLTDKLGNTALHLALERNFSADIVLKLLKQYPRSAKVKNYAGNLPLHIALKNKNMTCDVFKELISQYPESVGIKDKKDQFPFTIAKSNKSNISPQIMKFLPDIDSISK